METTAHKPYLKYQDGEVTPILAFRQKSTGTRPLVPGNGGLVPARDYKDQEFEIIVVEEDDSVRNILHG
jgi:hypothetical protein